VLVVMPGCRDESAGNQIGLRSFSPKALEKGKTVVVGRGYIAPFLLASQVGYYQDIEFGIELGIGEVRGDETTYIATAQLRPPSKLRNQEFVVAAIVAPGRYKISYRCNQVMGHACVSVGRNSSATFYRRGEWISLGVIDVPADTVVDLGSVVFTWAFVQGVRRPSAPGTDASIMIRDGQWRLDAADNVSVFNLEVKQDLSGASGRANGMEYISKRYPNALTGYPVRKERLSCAEFMAPKSR